MSLTCPHGQKDWACTTCCLLDLKDRLDLIEQAVTAQRKAGSSGGFVTGGTRSWEPINLSALALTQDIAKAGGLRGAEQTILRGTDPDMPKQVRSWRSRARLILGEALAPYPLLWTAVITVKNNRWAWHNPPVTCPVTDHTGTCPGTLLVHYDDQPYSPTYGQRHTVKCTRDDQHQWSGGIEWMRLGLLFGGVQAA